MLLHPQAQRALIIGYGSGMTVGALLQHPLRQVDVIEIAPEVIAADEFFHDVNHQPLADGRTQLIIEDARTFLYGGGAPYDIVISEPSNPWVAGIGNLFTREYFDQIADRLAPDGVLVQWFHVYEASDADVAVVLRTLMAVFQHVRVFQPNHGDLVIAAANHDNVLRSPDASGLALASALHQLGITRTATLLGMEVLPAAAVSSFIDAGRINRDRRPVLEYSVPRAFYSGAEAQSLAQRDPGSDETRHAEWDAADFRETVLYLQRAGMLEFRYAVDLLAGWCRVAPADPELSAILAIWLSQQGRDRRLIPLLLERWEWVAPQQRAEYFRTLLAVVRSARLNPDSEYVAAAAAAIWQWAPEPTPGGGLVFERLAELQTLVHEPEAARRARAEAARQHATAN